LKIIKCSTGASQANARVDYTVYKLDGSTVTSTAYTNPAGEVVTSLDVVNQERVHVKVTPFMSGSSHHEDMKFVSPESGAYDEWVMVDVIENTECDPVQGDGQPIHWTFRTTIQ